MTPATNLAHKPQLELKSHLGHQLADLLPTALPPYPHGFVTGTINSCSTFGDALPVSLTAEPALFHGRSGYGFFTIARALNAPVPSSTEIDVKPKRMWRERHYHVKQADQIITSVVDSVDTYVSQATFKIFKNGRKVSNVARIGALWVDLDTYKNVDLRHRPAEQLVAMLLQECLDCNLPRPSVVIDSGNGLYAKWILAKAIPEAALTRWRIVQAELCRRLVNFEADTRACDAARVLRAIGSTNGRTGRPVRVIWENTYPFDDHGGHRESGIPVMLYSFDTIADEILRETRERIREQHAKRAAAREAAKHAGDRRDISGLRRFSPQQLASDRYDDLQHLLRLRKWQNGAPEGERDMPLFVAATFLALMHPVYEFKRLVAVAAAQIAPTWTEKQINACIHSVLDRAERSRLGQASVWKGFEVDPRYTPNNAWLIDALRITVDEQKKFKTIIGMDEARRRDAQRSAARRKAAGAVSRDIFIGKAQNRREQAVQLRDQGITWAAVGFQLGISAGAARVLAGRLTTKRTHSSVSLIMGNP